MRNRKSGAISGRHSIYDIFPDFSIPSKSINPNSTAQLTLELNAFQLQIAPAVSPYTSDYIRQREPFTQSFELYMLMCIIFRGRFYLKTILRMNGLMFICFSRFLDRFLLCIWDTDGLLTLIEAAFHLRRWINFNPE